MTTFAQYLQNHCIEPLRLSVIAGVRYVTVWSVMHGNPISQEHATKIKVGLRSLTGSPYTGTIATIQERPQTTVDAPHGRNRTRGGRKKVEPLL